MQRPVINAFLRKTGYAVLVVGVVLLIFALVYGHVSLDPLALSSPRSPQQSSLGTHGRSATRPTDCGRQASASLN